MVVEGLGGLPCVLLLSSALEVIAIIVATVRPFLYFLGSNESCDRISLKISLCAMDHFVHCKRAAPGSTIYN